MTKSTMTTRVYETLTVQCHLQDELLLIDVNLTYAPNKALGGIIMDLHFIDCKIINGSLNTILRYGETIYSVITKSLNEQYDLKARYRQHLIKSQHTLAQ